MRAKSVPLWIRIAFGMLCAGPVTPLALLALWLANASFFQVVRGELIAVGPLVLSLAGVIGAVCAWSFTLCGIGDRPFGVVQLTGMVGGCIALGVVAVVQSAHATDAFSRWVVIVASVSLSSAIVCSAYMAKSLWMNGSSVGG